MNQLNDFQEAFMRTLARIQEECVLSRGRDPELLYDVTSDVIIRMMALLDGYENPAIGPVVCEANGQRLRENPSIELHDAVCAYLKGIS